MTRSSAKNRFRDPSKPERIRHRLPRRRGSNRGAERRPLSFVPSLTRGARSRRLHAHLVGSAGPCRLPYGRGSVSVADRCGGWIFRHRVKLTVAHVEALGLRPVERTRAAAIEYSQLIAIFIHGAVAIDAFR